VKVPINSLHNNLDNHKSLFRAPIYPCVQFTVPLSGRCSRTSPRSMLPKVLSSSKTRFCDTSLRPGKFPFKNHVIFLHSLTFARGVDFIKMDYMTPGSPDHGDYALPASSTGAVIAYHKAFKTPASTWDLIFPGNSTVLILTGVFGNRPVTVFEFTKTSTTQGGIFLQQAYSSSNYRVLSTIHQWTDCFRTTRPTNYDQTWYGQYLYRQHSISVRSLGCTGSPNKFHLPLSRSWNLITDGTPWQSTGSVQVRT